MQPGSRSEIRHSSAQSTLELFTGLNVPWSNYRTCIQTHIHTLTLLEHARLSALAQPALLAFAPHVQVHLAVAVVLAGVLGAFDDAASEEALAALAAQHVVVEAGGLVAAHAAHLIAEHLGGGTLLSLHRLAVCTRKQKGRQ